MRMRDVLAQVGVSPTPSIPELLFREFSRGRITKDEYETRTAIWVSENTREYVFRAYPKLPETLVEYAQSRMSNRRENREPTLYARIGNWIQAVRSLVVQNDSDHGLLVWSLERCQAKGLGDHARTIEVRLAEFCGEVPEHLGLAMSCHLKDSEEKQREQRRSSA